jgi:hypothetical protein
VHAIAPRSIVADCIDQRDACAGERTPDKGGAFAVQFMPPLHLGLVHLKCSTPSWTVCIPIAPILAASVRKLPA